MHPTEYLALLRVIRESGCYREDEPAHASVRRLMDERNLELQRAQRLKRELADAGVAAEAASDRIRRLEQEVLRLSTPRGAPVGWKPGMGVGVEVPPLASPPEDRSRVGRQRRELRRLNASQRLLRLEADRSQRLFEDAASALIETRKALRLAEARRDP